MTTKAGIVARPTLKVISPVFVGVPSSLIVRKTCFWAKKGLRRSRAGPSWHDLRTRVSGSSTRWVCRGRAAAPPGHGVAESSAARPGPDRAAHQPRDSSNAEWVTDDRGERIRESVGMLDEQGQRDGFGSDGTTVGRKSRKIRRGPTPSHPSRMCLVLLRHGLDLGDSPDDSAKVFGVDPLPSAFNAANITCARANNGTNAAYAFGCVCSECRESTSASG